MVHVNEEELVATTPVVIATPVTDETPIASAPLYAESQGFNKNPSNPDLSSLEPVPVPTAPPAPTTTNTTSGGGTTSIFDQLKKP